ncbi:TMV resistance protein N-like [Quercus lobata]|uniref:TMV resistance protein N-like n=1 Tax=Quercus lobata TaxID=97700 RepID=UPI001243DED3|nr:TMV resistance protein N-like [Quercus lobata]
MASSIDHKWKRDVFLSFRGEDTRNNFVGHLHASLERSGINTFKDDQNLQRGEEISSALLTAIQESRFSIVILSKNYASSTWCLKELVKIVECRSKGQTIYPIFYDVDPSEVRHHKGNFGVALENHERTLIKPDLEKVQSWRLALTEVANLSGWDTAKKKSEAEVIQEIVQRISEQKLSSTKISIAKHPVGIESHVQEISKLLAINPEEVRKVGIYGCQGVGKTTIAKAIYNRHASQFDGCSFLMNVRDKSKVQYQMVELQELLLHEILGEDMKLGNVDTGITVIKERLRHKRVLIVIDGVESTDPNPLDKLAGGLDWFGPGSRIILTTREESVLKTQDDVPSIYPVKTMGQSDAIQLFSWYAFKKNKPEVDYMKLVKAVVRHSKGLPSALVKLGSDLCSRSKDYWKSELSKYNAIEGENHDDIWIRRLNDLVERHYNDETGERHPSLLQLLNGTLESPSNNVHVPNFNMNALEQCDDVDWNDDFDLQSIKFEQSAEETSLPDADEISKQGMKAWEGQNENPYAGATQDVEKGEQWRNASQGGKMTTKMTTTMNTTMMIMMGKVQAKAHIMVDLQIMALLGKVETIIYTMVELEMMMMLGKVQAKSHIMVDLQIMVELEMTTTTMTTTMNTTMMMGKVQAKAHIIVDLQIMALLGKVETIIYTMVELEMLLLKIMIMMVMVNLKMMKMLTKVKTKINMLKERSIGKIDWEDRGIRLGVFVASRCFNSSSKYCDIVLIME